MKLTYIQRKSHVSSILWILGCGLGMTHYSIKKVYAGFDLGDTVWLCRRGEGFLCGDENTFLDRLITNFQRYIIRNPQHAVSVKKIFLRRAAAFNEFIRHLAGYDYSTASNKKLWSDYQQLIKGYSNVYPYSEPLAIAIGDLADKIKDGFLNQGLTASQFEKLLLPAEASFTQKEQLEFVKIAWDNEGKHLSSATLTKLYRHHAKYTWLPYDYGVKSYSFDYFRKQLASLLKKDRSELAKKYQNLKKYSRDLRKEQQSIAKKFKLGVYHQSLIKVIRSAYILVDSKKELFTRCHYYAENIFLEISSRFNIPPRLMRYMLPEEVEGVLCQNKKININKIQLRYDNCVLKIRNNGSVIVLSGKKAGLIINGFLKSRNIGVEEAVIKGRIANRGVVRGRVRVILDANQGENFRHGEILVAPMTSPDYIAAVRRAAAIITDEGGAICHAAIVARELDIPCIVGTRNATKILHDGDLVEVDADRGEVKIIKRR